MVLRQFLYLDQDLVKEFLGQVEGGLFEEGTHTTRTSGKKGMGGGLSAGPVAAKGERASERGEEVERVVRQTAPSEFERLYSSLQAKGETQFLDNIDNVIWEELKRGEIVEVEAIIQPAGLTKVAELFAQFEAMGPIFDAANADASLTEEQTQIFQLIKGLTTATPHDTFDVIASLASAPDYKFACTLRGEHLRVSAETLEGESTVYGKIQRKLRKGETQLVGSLLGGLEQLLDAPDQADLASIFDNAEIKAIGLANPQIAFPAAILTPIAVYR